MASNRIPSLDGLRAIAISLVLAGHAANRGAEWMSPRVRGYVFILALCGVKIFFVLSGFLITSMLQRELRQSGTISLKRFYWRRTLRIFPAMYVMLAVVAIAWAIGIIRIGAESPLKIFSAVFYVSDYVQFSGWPLHHTWSLSVEEQFYLLWPALLLVSGNRRAAIFPGLMILLAVVSRGIALAEFRFDSVADSLAAGCLLAIYWNQLKTWLLRWWPRSLTVSASLILPVIMLPVANAYSRHQMFSAVLGIPLFNFAAGIAILGTVLAPPQWLNIRPMVWLGKISYSLYLWQQPWVEDRRDGWWWLPCALACAWISYRFVEQPVLRWRDRVAPSATGSAHLPAS